MPVHSLQLLVMKRRKRKDKGEKGKEKRKGEKKRSEIEKISTVGKKKAQLIFILGLTLYCLGNV